MTITTEPPEPAHPGEILPEHRDRTTGRIDPVSVALALVAAATTIGGVKLLASGEAPALIAAAEMPEPRTISSQVGSAV